MGRLFVAHAVQAEPGRRTRFVSAMRRIDNDLVGIREGQRA
jgi:hypothetical protein